MYEMAKVRRTVFTFPSSATNSNQSGKPCERASSRTVSVRRSYTYTPPLALASGPEQTRGSPQRKAEGRRRTYAVVDDVGLLRRRLNVRHRRVEPQVAVEPSVEARPEAFARGRGERIRALPLPVDVLEVYAVKPSMSLNLGCGMREGAYLDSPRWASAVY